jgi:hypothetical protein
MKRFCIALPTFLMLLHLVGCTSPSLTGKWKRVGDNGAGTVIQVEKAGKGYAGKLLAVSDGLQIYGFKVGDVKWKELEPVEQSKWEGLDLVKYPFPLFQGPGTYENASFTLYDDGRALRVEALDPIPFDTATVQKWKRLE